MQSVSFHFLSRPGVIIMGDRCGGHTFYDLGLFDLPCHCHFKPRLTEKQNWNHNPDSIEENQIDPHVQKVVRFKILTTSQPFWTKCHPSLKKEIKRL